MKVNPAQTRWFVIIAYALLTASTQILWVTFTPITTEAAAHWHVSSGAVGWLSEVYPLIYVIISLPIGVWMDRWFRGALITGALLTGAGAMLRVVPGFSYALYGQIIVSLGQPIVLNAINKIAAGYVAPNRRPTAIAIGSASLFLGILLSTFSGPFLFQSIGLGGILWLQGLFSVVTMLLMLVALRHRPHFVVVDAKPVSVRAVWRNLHVRRFSLLLFAGFGLFVTLTTWLQVLVAPVGINADEVGIALGLMTVAGILGAALVPDWAVRGKRGRVVLCASLGVSAIAMFIVWAGHPLWIFMCLLMLTGFFLLADLPIVLTATETLVPTEAAATATSVLLLFGNLGGIVLALAVQVLLGHRAEAIGLLAVVVLAALPIAWRFPSIRRCEPGHDSSNTGLSL